MRNFLKKQTNQNALHEASVWFARKLSGELTRQERSDFDAWLAAHPLNAEAYKTASHIDSTLLDYSRQDVCDAFLRAEPELTDIISECDELSCEISADRPAFLNIRRLAAIAATIALLCTPVGIFLFSDNQGAISTTAANVYETHTGEQETVMLPDGSIITLNTDTRVTVAFTDAERRILMDYGEAFFDVAKDPDRPFDVTVGTEKYRAVGTAFNIRRRDDKTEFTVIEGIVEVQSLISSKTLEGTKAAPLQLTVGSQIVFERSVPQKAELSSQEVEKLIQWRSGFIHFDGATIEEIVTELQHYEDKEIVIASASVGNLVGGGTFDTDNVPAFLRGLETAFPIRIRESETTILLISETDDAP